MVHGEWAARSFLSKSTCQDQSCASCAIPRFSSTNEAAARAPHPQVAADLRWTMTPRHQYAPGPHIRHATFWQNSR